MARILRCSLNPRHRWSNGDPIKASDYVASFRRLIDPGLASPHGDALFSVKNAKAIWNRNKSVSELGVRAPDPRTLIIELEQEDPEFEYRLIHPALAPLPPGGYVSPERATELVASGPYRIADWKKQSRVRLEPNPNFPSPVRKRPPVEALMVDSDSTALSLYEAGKLSFLRRLVARETPRFQGSRELHRIPMARFDYVGFGPELLAREPLRQLLVKSVDFARFLDLFETLTPPGCPSIPASYMDKPVCLRFEPDTKLKPPSPLPKLDFLFSAMGGEDIARAAEWFQGQWKKHAGIRVELKSLEQGVYLNRLRSNPPAIFRKGVSLDRPTCLAALEIFRAGHPENYIRLNSPAFEAKLDSLARATRPAEKRRKCRQAVEELLRANRLIPLGEMYFTILAKPRFSGWDLNELNQLDLSELHDSQD
ncbi:MAG: peptide ABC transporter substrate-binding protein [Calothrix sp. SM1_5_4]|nr:peptide ABC transporter substrate-binding protein [Calothrix sp. SM1_5_4]